MAMLNNYLVACAILGLISDAIRHWNIMFLRDALCDSLSRFVLDADATSTQVALQKPNGPPVVQEGAAGGLCRHLRAPRKHGIQAPPQRLSLNRQFLVVFVSVRARKGIIPFLSSASCFQTSVVALSNVLFQRQIPIADHLEGFAHVY